jgi:hypothetical protein
MDQIAPLAQLVVVDCDDLVAAADSNASLHESIYQAYGSPVSTGILGIRNVPGFKEAKRALLPMAHSLATKLPESYQETELADPASMYNAGWSRGKEKLGKDKPVDLAKASYYYNPVTDTPGTVLERQEYPVSFPCNKWPDESRYEELAGFRTAACTLGRILQKVTVQVAYHLDQYVLKQEPSSANRGPLLHPALAQSEKVKCRLLYYYPLDLIQQERIMARPSGGASNPEMILNDEVKEDTVTSVRPSNSVSEDSWIGWHNDSGFLTALAGDMYIDHDTGEIIEDQCPNAGSDDASQEEGTLGPTVDPAAGLYVVDRSETVRRVRIPDDVVAVQMGECTQILTGGVVAATPHCVRGIRPNYRESDTRRIARISLPCFVDTKPQYVLCPPEHTSRQDILLQSNRSRKVPPLDNRWTSSAVTFGDFLQKTFQTYYEWDA